MGIHTFADCSSRLVYPKALCNLSPYSPTNPVDISMQLVSTYFLSLLMFTHFFSSAAKIKIAVFSPIRHSWTTKTGGFDYCFCDRTGQIWEKNRAVLYASQICYGCHACFLMA